MGCVRGGFETLGGLSIALEASVFGRSHELIRAGRTRQAIYHNQQLQGRPHTMQGWTTPTATHSI